jgi:hypothetical protein
MQYILVILKIKKSNISGFLNKLIPTLSHYLEDLHLDFLKFNNNNKELCRIVEKNLYSVYLKKIDLSDDGTISVPFRVNKMYKEEFEHIHNKLLNDYDTYFTKYVRTLLCEYCFKSFVIRELLYFYDTINDLKDSIINKTIITCYFDDCIYSFLPVSIEQYHEQNYLCGVDEKMNIVALKLKDLSDFDFSDLKALVKKEDLSSIYLKIKEHLEKGEK